MRVFFWTSSQGFLRDKAVQQTRLGALGNWVRIHETVDISSHYGMLNYQYFLCRHSIDGVHTCCCCCCFTRYLEVFEKGSKNNKVNDMHEANKSNNGVPEKLPPKKSKN